MEPEMSESEQQLDSERQAEAMAERFQAASERFEPDPKWAARNQARTIIARAFITGSGPDAAVRQLEEAGLLPYSADDPWSAPPAEPLVVEQPEAETVDLMAALRASVQAAKDERAAKSAPVEPETDR